MIKAYYTSAILMDILQQFGPLSEDIEEKKKFARWRAAHIHVCLRDGEQPTKPGTIILYDKEDEMNFKDFVRRDEFVDSDEEGARPSSSYEPSKVDSPSGPAPGVTTPTSGPVSPMNVNPQQPGMPGVPGMSVGPGMPGVPGISGGVGISGGPGISGGSGMPSEPTATTFKPVVDPELIEKAQKYCKWASSALNYEDVKTAVDNLQKALHLLQFGKEMA